MSKKIRNIVTAVGAIGVFSTGALIGNLGQNVNSVRLTGGSKALPVETDIEQAGKIAIVNQDEGDVLLEQFDENGNPKMIKYSEVILNEYDADTEDFVITTIDAAENGFNNKKYSAIIVIGSDFSKSINKNIQDAEPESIAVNCKKNKNLSSEASAVIDSRLKDFKDKVNKQISYMYVKELCSNLHTGQDYADEIIKGDKDDLEALNNIEKIDVPGFRVVNSETSAEENKNTDNLISDSSNNENSIFNPQLPDKNENIKDDNSAEIPDDDSNQEVIKPENGREEFDNKFKPLISSYEKNLLQQNEQNKFKDYQKQLESIMDNFPEITIETQLKAPEVSDVPDSGNSPEEVPDNGGETKVPVLPKGEKEAQEYKDAIDELLKNTSSAENTGGDNESDQSRSLKQEYKIMQDIVNHYAKEHKEEFVKYFQETYGSSTNKDGCNILIDINKNAGDNRENVATWGQILEAFGAGEISETDISNETQPDNSEENIETPAQTEETENDNEKIETDPQENDAELAETDLKNIEKDKQDENSENEPEAVKEDNKSPENITEEIPPKEEITPEEEIPVEDNNISEEKNKLNLSPDRIASEKQQKPGYEPEDEVIEKLNNIKEMIDLVAGGALQGSSTTDSKFNFTADADENNDPKVQEMVKEIEDYFNSWSDENSKKSTRELFNIFSRYYLYELENINSGDITDNNGNTDNGNEEMPDSSLTENPISEDLQNILNAVWDYSNERTENVQKENDIKLEKSKDILKFAEEQNKEFEKLLKESYKKAEENEKNSDKKFLNYKEETEKTYETIQKNVESSLKNAKSTKINTQKNNKDNMEEFIKLLENSRNGSVENEKVYNFIADPLGIGSKYEKGEEFENTKEKINNTKQGQEKNSGISSVKIALIICILLSAVMEGVILSMRKKKPSANKI